MGICSNKKERLQDRQSKHQTVILSITIRKNKMTNNILTSNKKNDFLKGYPQGCKFCTPKSYYNYLNLNKKSELSTGVQLVAPRNLKQPFDFKEKCLKIAHFASGCTYLHHPPVQLVAPRIINIYRYLYLTKCVRTCVRTRTRMRWSVSTDIICNHFLDVLVLKKSNGLLETDRRCCLA